MKEIKEKIFAEGQSKVFAEWLLIMITLVGGLLFALYVYELGLTLILVDQSAHLNIGRQVIDSITPGLSQIGFWPPLLHLLMFPFAAIDPLYESGLAGAAVLIPSLVLAAFFLYRLLFKFTNNWLASLMGALALVINPYVLYYSVTPMMEVLYLANLLGVAYFLVRWFETEEAFYLVMLGIFTALVSMSRFEGFIVLPLVAISIFLKLKQRKRNYHQIEAAVILYGFVAILGIGFILGYGWFFGDSPFAFSSGDWSAYAQQQELQPPSKGSPVISFDYLVYASFYMLGKPQVALVALSLFLLFFFPSLEVVAVFLILFSPFLFDWLALWRGDAIIYLPDLPPHAKFLNERYGLYWIAASIFLPIVVASLLSSRLKNHVSLNDLGRLLKLGVPISLFALGLIFFYQTVLFDDFKVVRISGENYDREHEVALTEELREKYDYGKVLKTRALYNYLSVNSGLPLDAYIQETNYQYYQQTLERPWLFARYVIMFNPSPENHLANEWTRQNEEISLRWGNSQTFLNYYDLIYENDVDRLYVLKEEAVREYAKIHALDPEKIPSLNPLLARWEPETIYEEMNGAKLARTYENNIPLAQASELRQDSLAEEASTSSLTLATSSAVEILGRGSETEVINHTVKPGETLWSIAQSYYEDGKLWTRIAEENNLRRPALLTPGLKLKIVR